MSEKNIVALHDQTPQISLPRSSFLRSRCSRSRRHDDAVVFFFFFFSFFIFLSRRVSLCVLLQMFFYVFRPKRKIGVLAGKREKKVIPKNTPLSRCCVGLPEEEALTKAGFTLLRRLESSRRSRRGALFERRQKLLVGRSVV